MTELNTSPVYPETIIYLKIIRGAVLVAQNDQIISLANAAIMRVVRAIRSMYYNAKIILL